MLKIIFWLPRLLIIAFILFLSLFALDVFSEGYGFWETLLALFMHLIPTLLLLVLVIATWKRPLVAGILFLGVAIIFFFWFHGYESWQGFLIVDLPLIVVGVLFLLNHKYNKKDG